MQKVGNCFGCEVAAGMEIPGGVISLGRGWGLNAYRGSESFLGWLVLQPMEHVPGLEYLSTGPQAAYGLYVADVRKAMTSFFARRFPQDPLEKIYVAQLGEYDDGHMHVHLIPRTRRMRPILAKLNLGDPDSWKIPYISREAEFPPEYRRSSEAAEDLMAFLRTMLPKR